MARNKNRSETKDQNSEKPFLTVTAKVAPKDAEKAARYFRLLQSLKMTVIFILFLMAVVAGVTIYNGLPLSAMGSVISGSRMWIYIILYVAFSLIYHIWYQPRQARRALIEIYGDTPYWQTRYSLYDTKLGIEAVGAKTSFESFVEYTDIRRIRELKYQILLRIQSHNLLSINKLGLSDGDTAALLKGLRENMPHFKKQ